LHCESGPTRQKNLIDGLGEMKMLRSTKEHGRLLLTADLLQRELRIGSSALGSVDRTFGILGHRFPPIDDLVVTLDHIASRETAA
jgi:hypothetical protein